MQHKGEDRVAAVLEVPRLRGPPPLLSRDMAGGGSCATRKVPRVSWQLGLWLGACSGRD